MEQKGYFNLKGTDNKQMKVKYTLIQQSPILHFQAEQSGSALRGSEVKAKLDRYLIKRIGIDNLEPKWIVKSGKSDNKTNSKLSLNYKIQIVSVDSHKVETKKLPKIYYGNMGDGEKSYIIKGNCKLTVICPIWSLLKKIKEYISDFFYVTNFGKMQSKGFGSYVIQENAKSEKEIIQLLCNATGSKKCYVISGYEHDDAYWSFMRDRQGNIKQDHCGNEKYEYKIFDDIQKIYQVMKSGVNFNGTYHKSFLFEYFKDKKHFPNGEIIRNEKAYIKQKGLTPRIEYKGKMVPYFTKHSPVFDSISTENNNKFVRALLGLAEHYEYINGKQDERGKLVRDTIKINPESEDIERIPSPIFFKIINGTIYIVANRIDNDVFGKEFTFNGNGESVSLSTPDTSEFDIDGFMEYFFRKYIEIVDQKDDSKRYPHYRINHHITSFTNEGEKCRII